MAKAKSKSSNTHLGNGKVSADHVMPELRWRMIAEAAYYRAQRRDFEGGDPVDDWLQAERDIDRALLTGSVKQDEVRSGGRRLPVPAEMKSQASSSLSQRK